MDMILDVERAVDIDALTYGDVHYWPVIRSSLFQTYLHSQRGQAASAQGPVLRVLPPQQKASASPNLTFVGPPETGLVHFDPEEVQRVYELGASQPDIMVFCRHEEMDQRIGDTFFARYLDSIFEVAAQASLGVIKIVDITPETFSRTRSKPCLFLYGNHLLQGLPNIQHHKLNGFQVIQSHLSTQGMDGFLSTEDSFVQWMVHLQVLADGFEHLLRFLTPKLILCTSYWHPLSQALILAANRLSIPTVDVQHGRLGPDHGAYTQLTKIPEHGFSLLPNYIWCWGDITQRDILRDRPSGRPFHQPIVGGNPWFERWPKTKVELDLAESTDVLQQTAAGRKLILLSLQPLETPLTELMLQSMRAAPEDWVWLVRAHPRQKQALADIAEVLDAHGVAYLDLEITKDLPLYALLEVADHQVTYYSSTALDGLDFGVPTTVLAGPSEEIFRAFIDQGMFRVATSVTDVLCAIQQGLTQKNTPTAKPFNAPAGTLTEATLTRLLKKQAV